MTPAHPEGGSAGARGDAQALIEQAQKKMAEVRSVAAQGEIEAADRLDEAVACALEARDALDQARDLLAATPEPPASHSEGVYKGGLISTDQAEAMEKVELASWINLYYPQIGYWQRLAERPDTEEDA